LVALAWKGGTEHIEEPTDKKETKSQKRYGTLKYLATWQGLRGEDLDIELDKERIVVCSKSKKAVIFRATNKHNPVHVGRGGGNEKCGH
jgi:hypothetical protein